MIEINEKTFKYALSEFKNIVEKDTNGNLVDFKTNSFVDEHENYKYEVLKQAKNELLTKNWKEVEIGNGRILKAVKKSIQTNVIYNYETHQNNLIDWRKKDNFNKLKGITLITVFAFAMIQPMTAEAKTKIRHIDQGNGCFMAVSYETALWRLIEYGHEELGIHCPD